VVSAFGASQGGAPDSIPSRLDRGEPVDVVIMAGPALDGLIQKGKVVSGSRVDIVRSTIGMVVRAGAPKPDISTVEALKRTLLEARSIAYSASASGTYLSGELFPRLGVADQIKGKTQRIVSERVGAVVARGDAVVGAEELHGFIHSHLSRQPGRLQLHADQVIQLVRLPGGVHPQDVQAAAVWLADALQALQGAGFASAVGSQQTEDLAPVHIEADARDGDHLAVHLAEIAHR